MAKSALQKRIDKCAEFEIGDLVEITNPSASNRMTDIWDSEMKNMTGEKSTIDIIDLDDGTISLNSHPLSSIWTWWSPFSLDKVEAVRPQGYVPQVGDTVKIIGNGHSIHHYHSIGIICEVKRVYGKDTCELVDNASTRSQTVSNADFRLHVSKPVKLTPAKIPQQIYQALQDKWVELNEIKVGSKVKVIRTATDFENGWDLVWMGSMSSQVGKVVTIDEIKTNSNGLHLDVGCSYPYFVLEPVVNENTIVKTSAGDVEITKEGYFIINGRKCTAGSESDALGTIFYKLEWNTVPAQKPSFTYCGWTFTLPDCEKLHIAYQAVVRAKTK